MAQSRILNRSFLESVKITSVGCIPQAILKNNLNLKQIKIDVKAEKIKENRVIQLSNNGFSDHNIAKQLGLKLSDVKHIISFDKLGLTYRKVGFKNINL